MQSIRAIFRNGVLEPLDPLDLRDDEKVTLRIETEVEATPARLEEISQMLRALLPDVVSRYHVETVAIFGSYIRGEQRADSDLDLLVTYSETPSLFEVIALERELGEQLGVKVDLVPRDSLKPALREIVLQEAVPL